MSTVDLDYDGCSTINAISFSGIFPQKIIRACFYWARTKLHPQQKLFKRSPDQLELFVCSGGLVSGTLSPRFFYLDLGRCLGPDPSTNNGGR